MAAVSTADSGRAWSNGVRKVRGPSHMKPTKLLGHLPPVPPPPLHSVPRAWLVLHCARRFCSKAEIIKVGQAFMSHCPAVCADLGVPGAIEAVQRTVDARYAAAGAAVRPDHHDAAGAAGAVAPARDDTKWDIAAAWLATALNCGGHGVPKDRERAARLLASCSAGLVRAAEQGNPQAQMRLAICLERKVFGTARQRGIYMQERFNLGSRTRRTVDKDEIGDAAHLFSRAAAGGCVGATARLALLYFRHVRDRGVGKDEGHGKYLLQRDAAAGCGTALAHVARLQVQEGRRARAIANARLSIEACEPAGWLVLADVCVRTRDGKGALRCLRNAISDSVGSAALDSETAGVCADHVTAKTACSELSALLCKGDLVEADLDQAHKWRMLAGIAVEGHSARGEEVAAPRVVAKTTDRLMALHKKNSKAPFAELDRAGNYFNLLHAGLNGVDMGAVVELVRSSDAAKRLGLSHNPCVGPAGGAVFYEALKVEPPLEWVRELYLAECGLEDTGALHVAAALPFLPHVYKLGLDGNSVTAKGAKGVAVAIEGSEISVLGLTMNQIGDDGADAIADSLARPESKLRRVYLNGNGITDHGCLSIAAALDKNGKVQKLGVADNLIGDKGGSALLAVLAAPAGSALDKLCCSGNNFGETVHWQLELLPNVFIAPRARRKRAKVLDGNTCRVVILWQPSLGSTAAAAGAAAPSVPDEERSKVTSQRERSTVSRRVQSVVEEDHVDIMSLD